MAVGTYAGTNYALRAAPRVGTWPNAAASNGQLYCMADEVYFDTDCQQPSLFYVGILPVGAVVQFSIVWPTKAAAYGAPFLLSDVTTFSMGNSAEPDLFGVVTAMNASKLPQVIEPIPDGIIYTTTLDFALRTETTVVITSATADGTATEGLVVKILYTMAGRTY